MLINCHSKAQCNNMYSSNLFAANVFIAVHSYKINERRNVEREMEKKKCVK